VGRWCVVFAVVCIVGWCVLCIRAAGVMMFLVVCVGECVFCVVVRVYVGFM